MCVYNWPGKGSDSKQRPNRFGRVSVAERACVCRGAGLGGGYRSRSTHGSDRETSLGGQKGARVGADLPAAPGSLSAAGRERSAVGGSAALVSAARPFSGPVFYPAWPTLFFPALSLLFTGGRAPGARHDG